MIEVLEEDYSTREWKKSNKEIRARMEERNINGANASPYRLLTENVGLKNLEGDNEFIFDDQIPYTAPQQPMSSSHMEEVSREEISSPPARRERK